MKRRVWDAALTSIVTLVITLGFHFVANHLITDKGRVVIGHPITISGSTFSEMQIENWSSNPLDGLILVLPAYVSLPAITSSVPIIIEEVAGYSGSPSLKRLSFGSIPPHRITRVLIPLPTRGT